MKTDAEKHAKEDESKKETVDTHNTADQLIYQTESQLKEAGDKITEDEKKPIEDALEQLKQANSGSDNEAIKKAMENLNTAWQPVAQKMYQAQQNQEETTPGSSDSSGKSDTTSEAEVEDADFEVVEEK
jgi:molecular chaperone DnaK